MFGISIIKQCRGKDSQTELGPDKTLMEFYSNLCSGNFEQATLLCDTLTMNGFINKFRRTWEETDSTVCAMASDILSDMTVVVTDTEKNGQTRTIFYVLATTDGQNKEKVATLRKEEGAWKIEAITDRL